MTISSLAAAAGSTTTVPAAAGSTTTVPRTTTTVNESTTTTTVKESATTTTVPATGYDVGIQKTGESALTIGQTATFILKPYNTGPSAVSSSTGIVVTDMLPSNFTMPVTANGNPGWNCSVSGVSLSCTYTGGSVGAGQAMPVITITAVTAKLGEGRNCAKITIEVATDTKPLDNEGCVSLIVSPVARNPVLTICKIIIPGNESGRFNLRLDGTVKVSSAGNNVCSGGITATVGTHVVSESAVAPAIMANYTRSFSGACDSAGSVTLTAGDNKTCTITNSRNPVLTIRKILIPGNDSGQFNLRLDGIVRVSSVGNNGSSGVITTTAGGHIVSETASAPTSMANYTQSFSGACNSSGVVHLIAGDNKICTITNRRILIIVTTTTISLPPPTCKVGDTGTGGGIVFYVSPTTINDQPGISSGGRCMEGVPKAWTVTGNPSAGWGCSGTAIGGTAFGIGTGASNTAKIMAGCATPGIAALKASNLTFGSKSDWFLPSRSELKLLGTFLMSTNPTWNSYFPGMYWSSSEFNAGDAWFYDMYNMAHGNYGKVSTFAYWPVRVFG